MTEKLTLDLLEVLVKHDLVPQAVMTALRNERIKLSYQLLRSGGVTGKEAREHLASINYLSEKQIETILYPPKEKMIIISDNNAKD